MRKTALLSLLLFGRISLFAQNSDYYDEEDVESFNRYSNFELSTGQIISIVIGALLFLVAKSIDDKNSGLRLGLGIVGIICMLPLLAAILAVAQKLIGYALILAIIVGGLYLIFNNKN